MSTSRVIHDGPSYIAGLFVADDFVIAGVAENLHGADGPPFERMQEARGQSHHNIHTDLLAGLRLILALLPEHAWVHTISIALPGPIKGSGTISSKEGNILTTTFHRRGRWWREVNFRTAVPDAIAALDANDRIHRDTPFRIIPDAAAYALGDYILQKQSSLKNANADADARKAFRTTTVFAHVTVDEGVGGALVYNGELMPSRMHAEMGHIPIRRHKSDHFEAKCPAHAFVGCVESLVALPALRHRWGEYVSRDLRAWPEDDRRLNLIAFYLAQLCVNLVLMVAPSQISLSGRVTRNQALIDLTDAYMREMLTIPETTTLYPGYTEQIAPHFVRRRNHHNAGIYGCLQEAWLFAGDEIRRTRF